MGRPPTHGAPSFRFHASEVAQMETILREHAGQVPPRELLVALATQFSNSSERAGKSIVQMKQVWNWFQNRRYALRAKSVKSPGNPSTPPNSQGEAAPMRNVPQVHQQTHVPLGHNLVRNASENSPMEFEAKSARDGAWYDVQAFLSHRHFETGNPEVLVRFAGFGQEEDEWVNVLKHVRQRSLPCESSECCVVCPGDLILCFQEGKEQALYFDAHVLDAQRRRHDVRGCRCRFLVRYDHDQSEEIVPLRKVCRRPETDYRLQMLHSTNETASGSSSIVEDSKKPDVDPSSSSSLRIANPTPNSVPFPSHTIVNPAPLAPHLAPSPAPALTPNPTLTPPPAPAQPQAQAQTPITVQTRDLALAPAPTPAPSAQAQTPTTVQAQASVTAPAVALAPSAQAQTPTTVQAQASAIAPVPVPVPAPALSVQTPTPSPSLAPSAQAPTPSPSPSPFPAPAPTPTPAPAPLAQAPNPAPATAQTQAQASAPAPALTPALASTVATDGAPASGSATVPYLTSSSTPNPSLTPISVQVCSPTPSSLAIPAPDPSLTVISASIPPPIPTVIPDPNPVSAPTPFPTQISGPTPTMISTPVIVHPSVQDIESNSPANPSVGEASITEIVANPSAETITAPSEPAKVESVTAPNEPTKVSTEPVESGPSEPMEVSTEPVEGGPSEPMEVSTEQVEGGPSE